MKNSRLPLSVSLVVPLYNNEKTLVSQLRLCRKILYRCCDNFEIIVCEDKSIDNSKYLLKKYFGKDKHFKLLFHTQNMGIAKTIFELYKRASYEYIFLFSVDGDWDYKDIEKLILYIYQKKADMIIGKRSIDSYTTYRKFISYMYNFSSLLLFQVNTIDAGSIKLFRRDLIKRIQIFSQSIFFEAEIIIKANKLGFSILSYPINFKKLERGTGQGGNIKLVLYSLVDLLKLRFNLWKQMFK